MYMNVLVTGGAGYIGSHTVVELIDANHTVIVVDNLVNSHRESLTRVEKITGKKVAFYENDLRDHVALEAIFAENAIDAVIHFAGLKAVAESVTQPLQYYRNNLESTLNLLEVAKKFNVKKFVFSSSATVYGTAAIPYEETMLTGVGITNPYGRTKYMIEKILEDLAASDPTWQCTSLRYFNPIGAHASGLIGEDPSGIPNNLMPFITQVASGRRQKLSIFGNDYPTRDGTCVRDYIHVVDLAIGHLQAIESLESGFQAINLGSGQGTSVMELVKTFEDSTGVAIPYEIAGRRDGDLAEFYADNEVAKQKLNWTTTKNLSEACKDTWKWQSLNPNGYSEHIVD